MKRRFLLAAPLILPAGLALAQQQGYNRITALSFSASGDNTAVAAVTAKQILVWGWSFSLASTTTVRFKSGANNLTGAVTATAWSQPLVNIQPYLYTNPGEALVINLGGAVALGGVLWYSV